MDIDSILFHAEEEILQRAIEDINNTQTLRKWIEEHGYSNHPIVTEKWRVLQEQEENRYFLIKSLFFKTNGR